MITEHWPGESGGGPDLDRKDSALAVWQPLGRVGVLIAWFFEPRGDSEEAVDRNISLQEPGSSPPGSVVIAMNT